MAEHTKPKKEKKEALHTGKDSFDRSGLEELLKRRFFYTIAFGIYNGVKGLYDYGPPGCAVKNNLLQYWRQHFVLEENMLEVETTALTPEIVLKTSGHVEKFQDLMVKDIKTGECYRADHLLEETVEKFIATKKDLSEEAKKDAQNDADQADAFSVEVLAEKLKKYGAVAPDTGNPVSDPFPFNLMFGTQIGPTGLLKGYLRPETAQGIFVNFRRLLEFNGNRLPFAGAQVGPAFRNEISPRSGLLRVREFTLAEIEHFVDPKNKKHPKFKEVANLVMRLYPRENQLGDKQYREITIGEAVEKGVVANETLGYFLARTQIFLHKVGLKPEKVRFRQHLRDEMAHYACDCWDAECQTSYGWIEIVGNADRSAYDLTVHSKASGDKLTAFVDFEDGPKNMDVIEIIPNKGALGKTLRADAKKVTDALLAIADDEEKLEELFNNMTANGFVEIEGFKLDKTMLNVTKTNKRVVGQTVTPSVIEPSFGIGRILYCMFEHAYYVRPGNDEARAVLGFAPLVAPTKCSILPLINDERLAPHASRIAKLLTASNISSKVDTTGTTIGKRYARTDEIGVPFGITIDFQTLEDDTVTLRERDSTNQIRIKVSELPAVIIAMVNGELTWADVTSKYPLVKAAQE